MRPFEPWPEATLRSDRCGEVVALSALEEADAEELQTTEGDEISTIPPLTTPELATEPIEATEAFPETRVEESSVTRQAEESVPMEFGMAETLESEAPGEEAALYDDPLTGTRTEMADLSEERLIEEEDELDL